MLLYHGSNNIIEKPIFGYGKFSNDYGRGFYCTEDQDLASEWAVDMNRDGHVNCYELDVTNLRILDLSQYSTLEWLAVLLHNRDVELHYPLQLEAKRYLLENFDVGISQWDIIKGYRADDSYFTFARDFLSGAISYGQLRDAMYLGELGEQVVLKSEEAFRRICYRGQIEVLAEEWYARKQNRDWKARSQYASMDVRLYLKQSVYINQILSEEMKRNDPRLR